MNGYEWVEQAKSKLEKVDLPFSTISLLIDNCFGVKLNEFILFEFINNEQIDILLDEVLKKEEPVAQIVGYEIFYGYKINITKDVLIPRVETEELVSLVIADIKNNYPIGSEINIADVCTGSGVIGLVIYQELIKDYKINLVVSDISSDALKVAKGNFDKYGVVVSILEGDLLEPFLHNNIKFDFVISNPPYIPTSDVLEQIVLNNEPSLALFGGVLGYEPYFKIIDVVNNILETTSRIYFEIGDGQGEIIKSYINGKLKCEVYLLNDLFGRERMIKVEIGV
jgi:release factor glutamine methyltransferase